MYNVLSSNGNLERERVILTLQITKEIVLIFPSTTLTTTFPSIS